MRSKKKTQREAQATKELYREGGFPYKQGKEKVYSYILRPSKSGTLTFRKVNLDKDRMGWQRKGRALKSRVAGDHPQNSSKTLGARKAGGSKGSKIKQDFESVRKGD